jgi:hypothetical protein
MNVILTPASPGRQQQAGSGRVPGDSDEDRSVMRDQSFGRTRLDQSVPIPGGLSAVL